jgi:uncharacterized NAD(P)/FAD-binding protein YdhS
MRSDVAVVGAGFSANAMAIHLLETLPPDKTLAVVGRSDGFGRGVAYSTRNDQHRLNVPAGRMSLWQDRPDDLVDWLNGVGTSFGPDDFIPRAMFGDYVRDRLQEGLTRNGNRARVEFVDTVAEAYEPSGDGSHLFKLANGGVLESRRSVLCLGATAAGLPLPAGRIDVDDRSIIANPWASDWTSGIGRADHLVFVGSGLTMIDQLMSLTDSGHAGPVTVVSRHGLLPQAHLVPASRPDAAALSAAEDVPLSDMMRALRIAARSSPDWRSAVDGLRPVTQRLWQSMSDDKRRRFLRHAAPWWNIHRHRMAPEIAAFVREQAASGRLRIRAGWLEGLVEEDGQAGVVIRPRHARSGDALQTLLADRVVNCTGLERCAIGRVPILRNMMAKGLVRSDRLGLGVDVDESSQIVDHKGRAQDGLFAVGPMTLGQFWEIFAVPDIRKQVAGIAHQIGAELE